MTQRLHPEGSRFRTARRRSSTSGAGGVPDDRTIPGEILAAVEPTLFGLPAEFARPDDVGDPPADEPAPARARPSDAGLLIVRRADRFGAGALVLAGVAANVSLSLSWAPGEGPTGLSLVQRGVEQLGAGMLALSWLWQPFAVVLSGGLLVLLGFLLLVPARSHRFVGVLALLVSLAAAAALVLLMADGGWGADQFGPGMWCAVAVPILGAIGALKAMLTAPLVTLDLRRPAAG